MNHQGLVILVDRWLGRWWTDAECDERPNLTADQQAQFKALFEQARSSMKARNRFQGFCMTTEAGFLADKFDAAGLKASVQSKSTQPGSHAPQWRHLIKAWQILTAEQQTKLVTRLHRWTRKCSNGSRCPWAWGTSAELAQKLQLNADQQAKIKALWQGNQPSARPIMQDFRTSSSRFCMNSKAAIPAPTGLLPDRRLPKRAIGDGRASRQDGGPARYSHSGQRQQWVTLMEQKCNSSISRGRNAGIGIRGLDALPAFRPADGTVAFSVPSASPIAGAGRSENIVQGRHLVRDARPSPSWPFWAIGAIKAAIGRRWMAAFEFSQNLLLEVAEVCIWAWALGLMPCHRALILAC